MDSLKKPPTLDQQPIWIDTLPALEQCIADLTTQAVIAVDTESDSLYSYFEKVCLIQFSTAETDYLIDPLGTDVSGLAPLFVDSSIQKIFHAAEYDILSLKRDYDFSFNNLFDTMIAAKVLGWSRFGLGSVLAEHFGVKLDKRYQRYDWGQRPLSQKALSYARLDTHYLLPLRELQLDKLRQINRLQEALAAFRRQTDVTPSPKIFDPDDFWRIKGAKRLKPDQQAILRELYILRDNIARKIDRPPFKVANDSTLVRLARDQPHNYETLAQTKGVSRQLVKHNASHFLKAIRRGRNASPPSHPTHNKHRPDEATLNRYETLRHWRNTLATERGVEPDVIFSNGTLMYIARRNPKTLNALSKLKGLGEWQKKTYGQALMQVLRELS